MIPKANQVRLKYFVDCLKLIFCEITNLIQPCNRLSKPSELVFYKCDVAIIGYFLWQAINRADLYSHYEYEEIFLHGITLNDSESSCDAKSFETVLESLGHTFSLDRFCTIIFQSMTYEWHTLDHSSKIMIDVAVKPALDLLKHPGSNVSIVLGVLLELIVLFSKRKTGPSERAKIYFKFLMLSQGNGFEEYTKLCNCHDELIERDYSSSNKLVGSVKILLNSIFDRESWWGDIEYDLFSISGVAYNLSRSEILNEEFEEKEYVPGLVFRALFSAIDNKNSSISLGRKFENFYYLFYMVLKYNENSLSK